MARLFSAVRPRGVTLVELLVVMSVLGVALALGAAPLRDLRQSNQLSSQVARFTESVRLARAEAIMRNVPVSICPSAMASSGAAACAGVYADGWIVFANSGADRAVDPDSDEVLRVFPGLPPGFTVTNRAGDRAAAQLINYRPDGSSRNNQTLVFCPPGGSRAGAVSVVINIVGRPRVQREQDACTRRGEVDA